MAVFLEFCLTWYCDGGDSDLSYGNAILICPRGGEMGNLQNPGMWLFGLLVEAADDDVELMDV